MIKAFFLPIFFGFSLAAPLIGFAPAVTAATGASLHWIGDDEAVWDSTSPNWSNNGDATAWQDGAVAVFDGTGQTVTVVGEKTVAGLRFESEGFALEGDRLISSGTEFEVYVAEDATISNRLEFDETAPEKTHFLKTGEGELDLETELDWGGDILFSSGVVHAAFPSPEMVGGDRTLTFADDVHFILAAPLETDRRWVSATESLTTLDSDFDVSIPVLEIGYWFAKDGEGKLAIGELNGGHWLRMVQGDVNIDHANDGRPFMRWGQRLQVSGYLTSLTIGAGLEGDVLSVGDESPARLTITYLGLGSWFPRPRVEFTLNNDSQDLIEVTDSMGQEASADFHFRGRSGLELGKAYELIKLPPSFEETALSMDFSLSQEMLSEGWAAAFFQEGASIYVGFCAFPDSPPLTLAQAAGLPLLEWRTSEEHPWITEPCRPSLGKNVLHNSTVPVGATSWLETDVEGPGVLAFERFINVFYDGQRGEFRVTLDGETQFVESDFHDWGTRSISIPEGVHTVRWEFTASEASGSGDPTVLVSRVQFAPRTFSSWMSSHGSYQGHPADADPDGGGIPLAMRYALGLEPLSPRRADLPEATFVTTDGDNEPERRLQLVFRRPRHVLDLIYNVEVSDTLENWDPVSPDQWTVVDQGHGWETVIVDDPVQIDETDARFLRLRVEIGL